MKQIPFISFLAFGLLLMGCKEKSKENSRIETAPIAFTKDAEALLLRENGDTLQHLEIEISDDDYERQTGLMYRKTMRKDRGMFFIMDQEEPQSFYMKNTYIPLDIIYLDSDSTIVSIQENAQPQREEPLPSEGPAKFVLEINAGLSQQWDLRPGDRIRIIE